MHLMLNIWCQTNEQFIEDCKVDNKA
uniref:Uncharacterized protein n=1 Tax=Anguilla anguilla TaxID=7936 RepID=A0A0E9S4X4_ANGAN